MPNPLYVDDPDFYERPGETVDLPVLRYSRKHIVPALPWIRDRFAGVEARYFGEVERTVAKGQPGPDTQPHITTAENWERFGVTLAEPDPLGYDE